MRRELLRVLAAVLIGLVIQPIPLRLHAADHREAPIVNELAALDLGDVFAFVNPNDTSKVIFAFGVNGLSNPPHNTSYSFDPDALYQLKIDNTGDAREDLVIQVQFAGTEQVRDSRCAAPARGGQFVTVLFGAPAMVGVENTALTTTELTGCSNTLLAPSAAGIRAFAGLREDPFVVDVSQLFRILAGGQDVFREATLPQLGPLRGRPVRADGTSGLDGFKGFNGSFVAVEVPKSLVQGTAARSATYLKNDTTIGVWGTTSAPTPGVAGHFSQIDRTGQQLLFTVFVPAPQRDALNAAAPENDMTAIGPLIPDALTTTDNDGTGNTIAGRVTVLNAVGVTALPNGAPLLLPSTFANTDKDLLRKALLPDALRLDLSLAPDNLNIGGNGLQNGRRLGDDVTDIVLQLARQLADVRFPSGSGLPGSGAAGSRVALNCTTLPACPDRRVLAVLQGTDFIKADAKLADLSTSGNDKPILLDFPFFAAAHPFPGDLDTVAPDVQNLNLMAAVLPNSRSVVVGSAATAFVTIANPSGVTAEDVGIAPNTPVSGSFTFQTTNPATNAPTGTANTRVDIPAGASQTFVVSITPNAVLPPTLVELSFSGTNARPVDTINGVNTLHLSASTTATPDIVVILATTGNNGIVDIPGTLGQGAFAAATTNVGAAADITVSADTGSATLPVTLTVCQTNSSTGACLAPAAASVTTSIATNGTATFAAFVRGTGNVTLNPVTNRVFLRFHDASGATRGLASVAVRTVP